MDPITSEAIRNVLRKIEGPDLESDIVSLGLLSEILITDGKVFFPLQFLMDVCKNGNHCAVLLKRWYVLWRVESVFITLTAEKTTKAAPKRRANLLPIKMPIEGVRHVIAVASGKGGSENLRWQ